MVNFASGDWEEPVIYTLYESSLGIKGVLVDKGGRLKPAAGEYLRQRSGLVRKCIVELNALLTMLETLIRLGGYLQQTEMCGV
jgi:hypothetical protein